MSVKLFVSSYQARYKAMHRPYVIAAYMLGPTGYPAR